MYEHVVYRLILLFNQVIVYYVITIGFFNLVQMAFSMASTFSYVKKVRFSDLEMYRNSRNMIPISVLVPAFNEASTIVDSISSLLNLNYITYEVIIINDGSRDDTFKTVVETFNLQKITKPIKSKIPTQEVKGVYYNPDYPKLYLIDKANGGKADALNTGVNLSRYPYFAAIDADSVLDSDALIRIIMSFLEYKYTVAVGGIVRISNGCEIKNGKVEKVGLPKSSLAVFQITEYLRAFLVGRMGWGRINSLLIISGAFGAFHKESVFQVGGYTPGTIGEDMDLIIKLHKYMKNKQYKYRIAFLPDPICWTQAPESVRDLQSQRRRWHIGLMDCMIRYRSMLFNPRYGFIGMVVMPYFLLFELLSPVVEGLGLIVVPLSYFFHILSIEYFVAFFVATLLFGIILSLGALSIEEHTFHKYDKIRDIIRLSFYAIVENFSFRQLTVYFRLSGVILYRKYKHAWGSITRKTFDDLKPVDKYE